MNDVAARTQTGEILDQQTPISTKSTETQIAPQPEITEQKPPTDGTPPAPTPPADKPADGTKPPDPATGAPTEYAAFKAPDNYTIDPKLIEQATPIFKELGLTQDQAQKLVDIQVQRELTNAKAPQTAYETMRADWQAKVNADPDLKAANSGGKTGLDAVKLDIGRALNAIGDEALVADFKKAMDITGAGDHPAFVKSLWKLSQHITEGKHVVGAGPSAAGQQASGSKPPSVAHALYPNLK
jgi:hypothetical protein